MNRLSLLITVLVVLIVGGALTTMFSGSDSSSVLPVVRQTDDPAASTLDVESWQAEQLFLVIVFVLFGVGGLATGIAALMWFLNREILNARAMPAKEIAETTTP